jgi:ubiquinone/menaquinone biosynthesis C-methylase UbiE
MKNHRQTISRFDEWHTSVQPSPRWTFLDESERLIKMLNIQPGDKVLEIGCGSGRNFSMIQRHLCGAGVLTAVDSSAPALRKASERIQNRGWKNVLLIEHEYGNEPIAQGRSDVVILSFWLSMVSNWKWALDCANAELRPGGRIGVVDFCRPETGFPEGDPLSYEARLKELFNECSHQRHNAWFGTLPFYIFVGEREVLPRQEVA